jgi:hypothetical protein
MSMACGYTLIFTYFRPFIHRSLGEGGFNPLFNYRSFNDGNSKSGFIYSKT